LAQAIKTRFHVAGFIPILMGLAGACLSLLWDVIYRGRSLSTAAVGPFKLAGVAAGIALAVAGLILGIVLGRRAAAHAGPEGMPSMARAYKLLGALLVVGGLGGTFLSLLWDVVRRGRAFSAATIGPFKLMGIAAGIVLAAIGIVMVLVLARKKPRAGPETPGPAVPPPSGATVQPVVAPIQVSFQKPQEEIPFALPVEEAQPFQAENAPMEAIPIED
jgi:hypothetical protein